MDLIMIARAISSLTTVVLEMVDAFEESGAIVGVVDIPELEELREIRKILDNLPDLHKPMG